MSLTALLRAFLSRFTSRFTYLRIVRLSAWVDILITAGFATPWTYVLVHDGLSALGTATGLGALDPVAPIQMLFANLLGSIVVVWAVLRLVRTRVIYGLYDGVSRALFATWETYAVLANNASRLLWFFVAIEVFFAVLELAPWLRGRDLEMTSTKPGIAAV